MPKKTTTIEEELPASNIPEFFKHRTGAVKIARITPRDGHLCRVKANEIDDLDDFLQDQYGGGTYQITYIPPIEEKNQKPLTDILRIAGKPKRADGGGEKGTTNHLLTQVMEENRELRESIMEIHANQAGSLAKDYSSMMERQAKQQEGATTQLLAILTAAQERDAARHQAAMEQSQQHFLNMQQAQEQSFSREQERARMHTQETVQMITLMAQQQGPEMKMEQLAAQVELVKGLLPEPGTALDKLIDKSPELISGLTDGVKSVVETGAKYRRNKDKPKKGNGAAGKPGVADDGFTGEAPAAGTKQIPEDTQHTGSLQEDLEWSEFEGWFNFLMTFDPSTWLGIVYRQHVNGMVPELLKPHLDSAMNKKDWTGIQELFEQMNATDAFAEFMKTAPAQYAQLESEIKQAQQEGAGGESS